MLDDSDVLIIGAGPVGIFSAFQAGMLGMSSCILDVLSFPGGQCSALYPQKYIYDIPAYPKITAQDLINKLLLQAERFSPVYRFGDVAKKINYDEKYIELETCNGNTMRAKAIIIAAGCGAFDYNKIPIQGIEIYESTYIHYMVNDPLIFKDKNIAIAGGGDSSADWAIMLSEIANKVYLIHRRDNFKCMKSSSERIIEISKSGKIELVLPFQISDVIGNGDKIETVEVKSIDKSKTLSLRVDHLLAFFGTKNNLMYIKDWGMKMDSHSIVVDPETLETNMKNIYAIGDVSKYPGKLKLIMTGFAESAVACHNIYRVIFPKKALNFEYSTNNSDFFENL